MAQLAWTTEPAGATQLTGMTQPTGAAMAPESGTARNIRCMVVVDPVTVPVGSPVMPTPAIAAENSDPDSQAEVDSGTVDEQPRDRHPARIERERFAINEPRIIFRDVHDIRLRRFDYDRLPLVRDGLLRSALQISRALGLAPHLLDCAHHRLRVGHVGLAE